MRRKFGSGHGIVTRSREGLEVDVTCRFAEDVAVLDLAGPFVVSEGETEVVGLRSALAALMAEGSVLVALNLASLTFVDARGLGELVSSVATLRRSGGELVLVAPTPRVKRILSVTRLDGVLQACDSESDAILQLRAMCAVRSRTAERNAAKWEPGDELRGACEFRSSSSFTAPACTADPPRRSEGPRSTC